MGRYRRWTARAGRLFWSEIVVGELPDTAAMASFYFLFALFPFLLFLTSLAAYLPVQAGTEELLARLSTFVPQQAFAMLAEHVRGLVYRPRPSLLTFGVLTSLFSASRGLDACRRALNRARGVRERRGLLGTQALVVVLTVLGALLVVAILAAIALGGTVGRGVLAVLPFGGALHFAWRWLRWPAAFVVAVLGLTVAMRLLPSAKARWREVLRRAVVTTVAWLLVTWALAWLVESFMNFNVTYGSIAGFIALALWIYVSTLVFLAGGTWKLEG